MADTQPDAPEAAKRFKIVAMWPDDYVRPFFCDSFTLRPDERRMLVTLDDGYSFSCPKVEITLVQQ